MKNNNISKRVLMILCTVMALLTIFSLSSFAIDGTWNGTGSGSGSGSWSSASGGYWLNEVNEDSYKNVIGYRLSVYDKDGVKKGNTCDIYNDDWAIYGRYYGSLKVAKYQRTKKQYKDLISGQFTFDTSYTPSSAGYRTRAINQCTYLKSIPQKPYEIPTWINGSKADEIFALCDFQKGTVPADYRFVIEPIMQAGLGGTAHALTVTELAVYGSIIHGLDYSGTSGDGDIGFINTHIAKHFPNLSLT